MMHTHEFKSASTSYHGTKFYFYKHGLIYKSFAACPSFQLTYTCNVICAINMNSELWRFKYHIIRQKTNLGFVFSGRQTVSNKGDG